MERVAAEMRGQVRIVPVKQIDYLIASGPCAELYLGGLYILRVHCANVPFVTPRCTSQQERRILPLLRIFSSGAREQNLRATINPRIEV